MQQSSLTALPYPSTNILVVDDSIDSLRFLSNMLTEQGYRVRKVLNGHMAITAAQSAPPDLILLDINMPQVSGYEVCQTLKADARTADTPIIFISALDEVLDRMRAFAVGGIDYITKPFQFEEVIARVSTQLQLRALSRDVTIQRQRAEQAEAEFQQLFHRVNQGLYQVKGDGTYHQVNGALASLLGYSSIEAFLEAVDHRPQNLYADPEQWLTLIDQLQDEATAAEQRVTVYTAGADKLEVIETLTVVADPSEVGRSPQEPYYMGFVSLP